MARLIAIDLGAYQVKITEFQLRGRRGVELVGRYSQRVPQDGGPPSLEAQLAALDGLIEDHPEFTVSSAIASWPGEDATLHRVVLPFNDAAKVEMALPAVVEGEIPFDMDDMVLGWRSTDVGAEAHAVAILARHDGVEERINALAERGVDPHKLLVDGDLAAWYAPRDERVTAVIDIGHTHTVVSIVKGGQVQMFRAVNVGGWAFTRAIQSALQCSWAEAEALKHGDPLPRPVPTPVADVDVDDEDVEDDDTDHGIDIPLLPEPSPAPTGRSGYATLPADARAAMDGAIGLLLAEIRTTLISAEDTLGYEIEEVRLTGGGARISELWDYINSDLGVPVYRATDPDGDAVPGPFAVSHALGMKLAGLTSGKEIDLRVDDLAFRGGTSFMRAALAYGASGMVFFSMAAVLVFIFQWVSLHREYNDTRAKLDTLITENWELAEAEKKSTDRMLSAVRFATEDATQRADALSQGTGGKPPMTDLIFELTNTFPPHPEVTVEVSQLTIDPANISFKAETDAFASMEAITASLQESERFSTAVKSNDQKTNKGKVTFDIRIPLETGGDGG